MYREISRKDKTLRDYQQNAKNSIFDAWDSFDNVMFQMPTGTGKTRLFTSIIKDIRNWGVINSINVRIIIIAHRIELIDQISESLKKYHIDHGIIAGGVGRDLRKIVQVASIQTLTHHSNIDAATDLNAGFVIIDEAHHSMANSYKKLWSMYKGSKKLGVTATPWRMNNSGFTDIYDKLILSLPVKQFIKEGWLSPYTYYSIKNGSKIKSEINAITEFDIEGDYKISALERVMDNLPIHAQLLENYLKYANGKKGIIYSISRKHSEHICKKFQENGINIVCIDSTTSKDARRTYVDRFKKGDIKIIVNVDIFSEGFDCPDIEFIQLARPTKSLVKFLQQVGRGLRPHESKSNCLILDNVGGYINFGLPDYDRDWSEFFVGDNRAYKKSKSNKFEITPSDRDMSFEEGNEDLFLISSQDLNIEENKNKECEWTENDDVLLKTLYIERNCPIEVISLVFKRNEEEVQVHIKELGLIKI